MFTSAGHHEVSPPTYPCHNRIQSARLRSTHTHAFLCSSRGFYSYLISLQLTAGALFSFLVPFPLFSSISLNVRHSVVVRFMYCISNLSFEVAMVKDFFHNLNHANTTFSSVQFRFTFHVTHATRHLSSMARHNKLNARLINA